MKTLVKGLKSETNSFLTVRQGNANTAADPEAYIFIRDVSRPRVRVRLVGRGVRWGSYYCLLVPVFASL